MEVHVPVSKMPISLLASPLDPSIHLPAGHTRTIYYIRNEATAAADDTVTDNRQSGDNRKTGLTNNLGVSPPKVAQNNPQWVMMYLTRSVILLSSETRYIISNTVLRSNVAFKSSGTHSREAAGGEGSQVGSIEILGKGIKLN